MPYSSNKIFHWGAVHCFLCCVFTWHENITAVLGHFLYFQVDLAVWHKPGKQNKAKISMVFSAQSYQNQRKQIKETENEELWEAWISLKRETNLHIFQSVRVNQDAFIGHVWTWLCCKSVHELPSCVTLKQNPVFATLHCPIPRHQVLDVPSAAAQYTPVSMIADIRKNMHNEHSISILKTVWGCIVCCVHWSKEYVLNALR